VSAGAEGLRVCLGSDWAPSGSRSLLGELKVADLVNRTKFDGALFDEDLCAMATRNPADALSWSERLGRLKPGLHGDVLVMADRGGDPYRNLIEGTERDVLFTAINGYPTYGTPELMRAAGAEEGSEPIRVAGRHMRIVLVYDWIADADWGWAQVMAELEDAGGDPRAYLERHPKGEGAGTRLALPADKPFDAPKEINFDAKIPPLEGLATDKGFLAALRAGGFHGGALNAVAVPYGTALLVADRQRTLMRHNLIVAGANVLANVLVIPTLGLEAAAGVTVGSVGLLLWLNLRACVRGRHAPSLGAALRHRRLSDPVAR
jgi:hypothetical protein